MLALLLGAVSTVPLPVLGSTWIVDDDGGPGVDFTALQPAFDAAAPNDVILVQPGSYAGGTLSRGVRVVGEGGPLVSGTLRVQQLPQNALAVLSGLRAAGNGFHDSLDVSDCQGLVVGEDLQALAPTVTNSLVVR